MVSVMRAVTPHPLDQDERLNWLRLIRSENVGPITFRQLLDRFATATAALEALPDLAALVDSVKADLLIIDTPGLDPFDSPAVSLLAESARAAGADCYLTLPAGLDASESAETALVFKEAGAAGMFVTKIDVTRRLGGLLSAAKVGGLPLLGAGVAPTIADGLAPLGPIALARLLLPDSQSLASPTLATGTQS